MINSLKIKSRMVAQGITQSEVASRLGLSKPAVSLKINGLRPFYLEEAAALSDLLGLTPVEFNEYFFSR